RACRACAAKPAGPALPAQRKRRISGALQRRRPGPAGGIRYPRTDAARTGCSGFAAGRAGAGRSRAAEDVGGLRVVRKIKQDAVKCVENAAAYSARRHILYAFKVRSPEFIGETGKCGL